MDTVFLSFPCRPELVKRIDDAVVEERGRSRWLRRVVEKELRAVERRRQRRSQGVDLAVDQQREAA